MEFPTKMFTWFSIINLGFGRSNVGFFWWNFRPVLSFRMVDLGDRCWYSTVAGLNLLLFTFTFSLRAPSDVSVLCLLKLIFSCWFLVSSCRCDEVVSLLVYQFLTFYREICVYGTIFNLLKCCFCRPILLWLDLLPS